eukprot:scaffold23787_cov73-Phaeocystis_antarctica.AAC.6
MTTRSCSKEAAPIIGGKNAARNTTNNVAAMPWRVANYPRVATIRCQVDPAGQSRACRVRRWHPPP